MSDEATITLLLTKLEEAWKPLQQVQSLPTRVLEEENEILRRVSTDRGDLLIRQKKTIDFLVAAITEHGQWGGKNLEHSPIYRTVDRWARKILDDAAHSRFGA